MSLMHGELLRPDLVWDELRLKYNHISLHVLNFQRRNKFEDDFIVAIESVTMFVIYKNL